jgi:hypothetical protein
VMWCEGISVAETKECNDFVQGRNWVGKAEITRSYLDAPLYRMVAHCWCSALIFPLQHCFTVLGHDFTKIDLNSAHCSLYRETTDGYEPSKFTSNPFG